MRNADARLERRHDRWHVTVRKGAEGAAGAVWVSLGGCPSQIVAMRLWMAVRPQDKRE